MTRNLLRMALESAKDRAAADAEASQTLADQLSDQYSDLSKQGEGIKPAIDPKKIESKINNVPKDEKVKPFVSMGPAEDLEVDIALADNESQIELDKSGEQKASMETLMIVQESLLANMRNKTCTADSIAFARHIVNQELSKARLTLPARAMESNVSLEEQHKIVLESIGSAISRIGQQIVMNYKHTFNAIVDTFKSVEQKLSKYEGSIAQAENELASKKGSLKSSSHTGSLTELWYFFSTEKGQANNIIDATKHDLEMSSYVLSVYPKIVISQMKALQAIFRSARPTDTKSVARVFDAIEKLKNPGPMFDKKYLGNYSYFNVTGLELVTGKSATPATFAGKAYPGIANLATTSSVRQRSKASHTASKVAISSMKAVPGPIGLGAMVGATIGAATLKYSTDDISKMIDFGKDYIENIKDVLGNGNEMSSVSKGWRDSLEDFFLADVSNMSPEDTKAHNRLCFQISMYCENLTRCFASPMYSELSRSLRAIKYIGYVTKRMVYDAS